MGLHSAPGLSALFSLHVLCALADFHVGPMDAGPCRKVQSVSLQSITRKGSGRRGLSLGCFLEDLGGGRLGGLGGREEMQ